MEARVQRRLAAILAADIAGYSRLMGEDEEGTLAALNALRIELIDPCIGEHRGRIVKTTGDGFLAEFGSVVDAVRCAVTFQDGMIDRNSNVPQEQRIEFRIGINLGDVIVQGDDVYGDGVNVAARLEGLSPPGGVCLSEDAFRQVRGKVDCDFDDMGPQEIKNIPEPVRAYCARPRGASTSPPSVAAGSRSAPPLPSKPSIAVLPFANMSADPEQEYFSDGITEDIITELARLQSVFVIARNSVFTYKGKSVRVQDVGRDLGVHYVVEGSVRRGGNTVRVTVQLVEAQTGNHVWAERYDRELTDVFELQDELVQTIVGALPGRLESADIEKVKRKRPQDMNAYDCVLRAKLLHHRGMLEDNVEAMRLFGQAIALDPEFAPAYAWRACTLGQAMARGYAPATAENQTKVYNDVLRGLSIDGNDLECIRIQCEFCIEHRRIDEALRLNDKALRLNPNEPRLHAQRGEIMGWAGRPEEGVECLQLAMRLDPYEADAWAHLLGRNLYDSRRYAEAVAAFMRVRRVSYWHHAYLAACYACLDDNDNAAAARAECLRLNPDFRASNYCANLFYQDPSACAHVRRDMVRAGLPD